MLGLNNEGNFSKVIALATTLAWINTAASEEATAPPGVQNAQVVTVRKGGEALLGCEVPTFGNSSSQTSVVIQWFRDKEPIFIKVGGHDPHVNHGLKSRISVADDQYNASLKIANVTLADAKWYECQILSLQETHEEPSNGTWFKLEVTDPPSFVETPPRTKIARQGHSLLLKCRATGRPEPVITWRKDGRLVRDGQDGILLSRDDLAVSSLTTVHRGKYTCLAQSVEGQIRFTTDVKVAAPPEFVKRPWDLTTQEGRDAMFECSATGYPTDVKYSWTYGGDPVTFSERLRGRYSVLADGSLVIYNINTDDRANVSCTAYNGFGSSPTATASLHVQFRARVTQMPAITYAGLGLKAILRCPSEAEPPVNKVDWRKGGRRISPYQDPREYLTGDGSLVISPVSYVDAGRYTCTPYNIHGTLGESTATELRIKDPPYFIHKPELVYEAELGKSIAIPCKGAGDPPPAVNWRKMVESDETVSYSVELGTLAIDPVTKAAHGTWQCVLTNSVAEVAEDVEIYVKYTRPHEVRNVTAEAISDTAVRVEWTPGYSGGYPQSFIVWYRQAGEADPSWQTHDVGTEHTVAALENLAPGTEYEVAVLPENKIRSGPFSDTINVKTEGMTVSRPTVVLVSPLLLVPHSLYSSTTDEGLVQLSWSKPSPYRPGHGAGRSRLNTSPSTAREQNILGFLVEFRWTGIAEDEASDSGSRRTRRAAELPAKGRWEALTTTNASVTSVLLQPDHLYRDLDYEFRVLTASEKKYSPPSTVVSFSTKGLTAYPCYIDPLQAAAVISDPTTAIILSAVVLMLVLVGLLIFCFCRKRRRKRQKKAPVVANEEALINSHQQGPTANGKVNANRAQPAVVDLTRGETGAYGRMKKIEYESSDSEDDGEASTPFIRSNDNIIERASEPHPSAFAIRQSRSFDSDSRKETLSSDRSSVRLRRETAARIFQEQHKRRSLTDHTYRRAQRGITLRGGTRSASTSPERRNVFGRLDDLNVTAPAALEDQKGRKKIRLYSRPIDDSCSAQQRRMIVIKRKSQKSSNPDAEKRTSKGAPPSDSSESPVFGVVGTIKKHSSDENLTDPSPSRRSVRSGRRTPFKNNPTSRSDDVTGAQTNDFIIRSPISSFASPILPSSSRDHSSPDVSPNRVVARRTVAYDPMVDAVISPRSYSGFPPRRYRHRSDEEHMHEQRAMHHSTHGRSENYRGIYPCASPNSGVGNPSTPYERGRAQRYYQNPGYQMVLSSPARTRYSFAQYPQLGPTTLSPHRPIPHNVSRSRASYSYNQRHPMVAFSPPPTAAYERPRSAFRVAHPSPGGNLSAQAPASEQLQPPQSTCEIDCSNSDIEVRFFKDADGNARSGAPSRRGEMTTTGAATGLNSSTVTDKNAGSALTPAIEDVALDFRHNARNMSTSDAEGTKGAKMLSPTAKYPQGYPFTQTPHGGQEPFNARPRRLLSPLGQGTPSRHAKLNPIDGSDCGPTSPPLGAIGSSDYGSQDTSNSSTCPNVVGISGLGPTSPSHLRFPVALHDRMPRLRDNSSVEDNYEWDSEIAMESEILEALRHFGTLKKSGPVSDELLDELKKITKDARNIPHSLRAQSADILESRTSQDDEASGQGEDLSGSISPGLTYSNESMARRCAAIRAEFLRYQQLQQVDEDHVT